MPFYHTFGCVIGNLNGLMYGAKLVSPNPHFDALACIHTMQAERLERIERKACEALA